MADIKRYALAGGALAAAAAIGIVMQSSDEAKMRYAASQPAPELSGTADNPLEVTEITLTSAVAQEPEPAKPQATEGVQTASLGEAVLSEGVETDLPQSSNQACAVTMNATPQAAAMVDVTLNAPCFSNERVTMHHNGMMFTAATDEQGVLAMTIPALTQNAVFIAAFASGEGALASASVDSLEFYDRKVVQSKAKANVAINAFEFGADFRQEGHVNAQSKRGVADAARGQGGFVTRLGDQSVADALVAEVYTFPTATSKQSGDVHVSVDVEVSTSNCGLRIEAQTLEVSRGGKLKVQDLTLPVPSCDAVGDFLVLQNLLADLKVARS